MQANLLKTKMAFPDDHDEELEKAVDDAIREIRKDGKCVKLDAVRKLKKQERNQKVLDRILEKAKKLKW